MARKVTIARPIAADRYDLFTQRLERCQAAYAQGNLGAVCDALHWCAEGGIALPSWLSAAAKELAFIALGLPTKKKRGRNAAWIQQYQQDMRDYAMWSDYRDAMDHGVVSTDGDAARAVSIIQRGSGKKPRPSTVEGAVKRFQQRSKKTPLRYMMLHTIRIKKASRGNTDWAAAVALIKKERVSNSLN